MPDTPQTVTLVSPEGAATDVPVGQVDAYKARGFTAEDEFQRAGRIASDARAASANQLDAFGQGVGRAFTLGGSDVVQRALGGENARIYLDQLRQSAPTASLAGELAGSLVTPGVGELGAAIREGGGVARAIGAGIAEGGIYGAGNAVSELALSNDPLTAEHVASVLSSNMLLGGAIGGVAGGAFKGIERGLQIAGDKLGEATAAKAAIDGLPPELASLDDNGLKVAFKDAAAAHAADVDAEKATLEQVRVKQRAELADQVKDLHDQLANESPVYQAVQGDDVAKIDGVNDIKVQLAKSFKSMRSAFDNPIGVARDPYPLIRPLEQRQAALEALQVKAPELQAALGNDARAAALDHIDQALDQTKQQIAAIRAVSKETPLASERLTQLQAGPSARMQAIADARDALKNAPELGLVGQGAKSATFAGVTALAHLIPGVGIAAPFVGKAASDAVGRLFGRMAGTVGKVSEKASAAADKFLGATKTLEPYAAPAATKTLAAVKFAAGKSEESDDLAALYKARTGELYQQTMRQPDGTTTMRPEARAAMAQQLDPIRQVNPILADKVETVQARKTAYLAQIAPKKPDPPAVQIGPDTSRPSDMAIRAWARAVRAVEDPSSVEERLARGIVTPEESQAYRAIYPERFAALQRAIFEAAPQLEKTLPMGKKVALSVFTGIPVTPAMQPNVLAVLQSTFDVESGSAGGTQAPRPEPSFGRFGSLKDIDKPTPAQERQQ